MRIFVPVFPEKSGYFVQQARPDRSIPVSGDQNRDTYESLFVATRSTLKEIINFVITMSDVFENVMELAKRRGFIWPTSECYGAVAGFIDYGPLGAMMKRRIENVWRDFYVIREGYYEIECPTIAQEAVFIASGHVAGFADRK